MIIILCSDMPCEVGAAALYKCLVENSTVIQMRVDEARSFPVTSAKICSLCETPTQIILLGTYWNDCLEDLTKHFDCDFILYCFGKVPADIRSTGTPREDGCCPVTDKFAVFMGENGTGPTAFLFNQVKARIRSPTLTKLYENNFGRVINLIDDRIYYRNIVESQPFYTGLFNYDSLEMSLFDKFIKLFQGDYNLEDIIKSGRTIAASQVHLTRERVIRNSKCVTLEDGTKAVVTEAPDLVYLSHDALHNKYSDAQITIIMNMRFGVKNDELAYSIRSFDANIDASDLAKKIKGDGNKTAAGGRIKFEFPIPF